MYQKLNLVLQQFVLNIKQVLRNFENIFLIIFFIFFTLLIPVIFIPFWSAAAISFGILLIIINGITYSTTNFTLQNSILNKNIRLTKSNKKIVYIATIVTMLFLSTIFSFFLLTIFLILNKFGLLLVQWLKYSSDFLQMETYIFQWQIIIILIYYIVVSTLILFSISYVIEKFIKTKQGYFIFVFSLLLLIVIFGGAFNDYFQTSYDGMVDAQNLMFPSNAYWFTLIFPFASIGQLLNNSVELSMFTKINNEWVHSIKTNLTDSGGLYFFETHNSVLGLLSFNNSNKWIILMAMPWIEIVLFLFVGNILANHNMLF